MLRSVGPLSIATLMALQVPRIGSLDRRNSRPAHAPHPAARPRARGGTPKRRPCDSLDGQTRDTDDHRRPRFVAKLGNVAYGIGDQRQRSSRRGRGWAERLSLAPILWNSVLPQPSPVDPDSNSGSNGASADGAVLVGYLRSKDGGTTTDISFGTLGVLTAYVISWWPLA